MSRQTLLSQLHDRLGLDVGFGPDRKVAQARLNRVMAKHKMTPEDVRLVIDYAVRHNKLVRHVEGLPYLLPDARAEKVKDDQQQRPPIETEIADAVVQERALYGDTHWVAKLIRAQGNARQTVLEQWRQERGA